jgi:hypothetical protein
MYSDLLQRQLVVSAVAQAFVFSIRAKNGPKNFGPARNPADPARPARESYGPDSDPACIHDDPV